LCRWSKPPLVTDVIRYAGWGFSQTFYREKVYEIAPTLGFKDLEDFMVNFWEAWALSKGAANDVDRSFVS
jgi:hypothetical protein